MKITLLSALNQKYTNIYDVHTNTLIEIQSKPCTCSKFVPDSRKGFSNHTYSKMCMFWHFVDVLWSCFSFFVSFKFVVSTSFTLSITSQILLCLALSLSLLVGLPSLFLSFFFLLLPPLSLSCRIIRLCEECVKAAVYSAPELLSNRPTLSCGYENELRLHWNLYINSSWRIHRVFLRHLPVHDGLTCCWLDTCVIGLVNYDHIWEFGRVLKEMKRCVASSQMLGVKWWEHLVPAEKIDLLVHSNPKPDHVERVVSFGVPGQLALGSNWYTSYAFRPNVACAGLAVSAMNKPSTMSHNW